MIEDLVDAGVYFHFTRDNLVVDKNSCPGEKLCFYLGVVLAKHYIDNLKIEIRKGMDQRWQEGHWNSMAPLGYKNIRDDGGRAKIEFDSQIAPHIRELFELYATGNYSYKALANYLNDNNVKVLKKTREEVDGTLMIKRKEYPVSHKSIEKILCNPFYYGARRSKGVVSVTGKEKHDALITKELFDKCQKTKSLRAMSYQVSLSAEIAKPFMNLLKCGVCNHSVTGEAHKKFSGRIYVYYHCANQSCAQRRKNVREELILAQLIKALEPFSRITPEGAAGFIENLKDQLGDLRVYASEKLLELEKKKVLIEARSAELLRLFKAGSLNECKRFTIPSLKW